MIRIPESAELAVATTTLSVALASFWVPPLWEACIDFGLVSFLMIGIDPLKNILGLQLKISRVGVSLLATLMGFLFTRIREFLLDVPSVMINEGANGGLATYSFDPTPLILWFLRIISPILVSFFALLFAFEVYLKSDFDKKSGPIFEMTKKLEKRGLVYERFRGFKFTRRQAFSGTADVLWGTTFLLSIPTYFLFEFSIMLVILTIVWIVHGVARPKPGVSALQALFRDISSVLYAPYFYLARKPRALVNGGYALLSLMNLFLLSIIFDLTDLTTQVILAPLFLYLIFFIIQILRRLTRAHRNHETLVPRLPLGDIWVVGGIQIYFAYLFYLSTSPSPNLCLNQISNGCFPYTARTLIFGELLPFSLFLSVATASLILISLLMSRPESSSRARFDSIRIAVCGTLGVAIIIVPSQWLGLVFLGLVGSIYFLPNLHIKEINAWKEEHQQSPSSKS